ncbi:MAG: CHAT domain-containing protein [Phycisphaerae bacterium]|nr:CHAT domain-containing protein [Phycisphaerae bacterium]
MSRLLEFRLTIFCGAVAALGGLPGRASPPSATTNSAATTRESAPTSGPTSPSAEADDGAAELQRFIAELNAPTVDAVLQALAPIPTLAEVRDAIAHPERFPKPPEMSDAHAKQLTEWLDRIDVLRKQSLEAPDEAAQRAALDEAITLSDRIVERMARAGSEFSPHDVADARAFSARFRILRSLPQTARREIASAEALRGRVMELYRAGQYIESRRLAFQQVEIFARRLSKDDAYTDRACQNLAAMLFYSGEYSASIGVCGAAIMSCRRLLGDAHPDVYSIAGVMGEALRARGDYAAAEAIQRKAALMRMMLRGPQHRDVAISLNNLSLVLQDAGDAAGAEPFAREALRQFRALAGNDDPLVATALNNVAAILRDRGDFTAAEPLARESIELHRRMLGPDHPSAAIAVHNLAQLLSTKGDHEAAEPLYREALAATRRQMGADHPYVGFRLNNLASVLAEMGDDVEAERLSREALDLFRKRFGNEHRHVAASLYTLSQLQLRQGRYADAETSIREAMAVLQKQVGDRHPSFAVMLGQLAETLLKSGRLADAETSARRAAALSGSLLGGSHPDAVANLGTLMEAQVARGDYVAAVATAIDAAKCFQAARLRAGSGGFDRTAFSARYSPYERCATVLLRNGRGAEAWQCLEEGFARGLLDAVAARRTRPLTSDEREREDTLLGRLARLDERIASLTPGPAETSPGKGRSGTDALRTSLRRERDARVTELAAFERSIEEKYGAAAGDVYELPRVQAAMQPDAALVAWVDLQRVMPRVEAGEEHWACVVRSSGAPHWVALPGTGPTGAWSDADASLPARVRRALSSRDSDTQTLRSLSAELHRQRIAPIEAALASDSSLPPVRRLMVIPVGTMAGIPIDALTDRYTVSYSPSATIFAWLAERPRHVPATPSVATAGPTLLAVGDPSLARPGHAADSRAEFAPLPATRVEVQRIAALFPGAAAEILVGDAASEPRLDALSTAGKLTAFRYIHFATHGVIDDRTPMRSSLILSQVDLPDAYAQVLAGREAYDGRLTVDQIIRTWKLDADLVTLSACQTALGRGAGGEGMIGFSQALFVAGARSLLLSLWKVDDAATSILMEEFYRRHVERGLRKSEALREAKRVLREMPADEARKRVGAWTELAAAPRGVKRTSTTTRPAMPSEARPFASPYYWAAFALIGDAD